MAQFGEVEAQGLVALLILIAAAALLVKWALSSRSLAHDGRLISAKLRDFEEREEVNRLRHRDFDGFLERLNERRGRLGQPPLTKAYLEPHRYNLMYSVDAGDIDEAALEKLKKRVEKAVKEGGEPVEAVKTE